MTWTDWAADVLLADREAARPGPLRPFPLPGVHLKDETGHPTGSLKHAVARELLLDAVQGGRLARDTPLVDATSGNLAVAEAYFARQLGLPFTAVVPERTGPAKRARIQAHGGQVLGVHPPLAVYERAAEHARATGGHYLDHLGVAAGMVDARRADPEQGLAAEILRALPEPPDWVVVGAGTGITSRWVGRYLRHHGHPTRLAVVDPENSAYFPGWASNAADYGTGMPSAIEGIGRPRLEPAFDPEVVDLVIPVPDAASVAAMRLCATVTGPHVGPSTGTALWGACHLVARERGTVVVVAADSGRPYLDTYYNDAWVAAKGWDLAGPAEALARFLDGKEWSGVSG